MQVFLPKCEFCVHIYIFIFQTVSFWQFGVVILCRNLKQNKHMAKKKSSPTKDKEQIICTSKEKNTATFQPLSEYEYDAMWMSYRYAIGRHTIATAMHAGQLVQAMYHRLDERQREQTVCDMRREISTILNWQYNFNMDLCIPLQILDPFKSLYAFSFNPCVEEAGGLLKYLQMHRVTVFTKTPPLLEHYIDDSFTKKHELSAMGIDDLLEWANAASVLDKANHYIATVEYEGKTEYIEVFESYSFLPDDKGIYRLAWAYSPVEDYLANPVRYPRIDDKFIKWLEVVK